MVVIGSQKSLDRLPPFQYLSTPGQVGAAPSGIGNVNCFSAYSWSESLPKSYQTDNSIIPPVFWDKRTAKKTQITNFFGVSDGDVFRDPPVPYRSKGSLMMKVPKAVIFVYSGNPSTFAVYYNPSTTYTNPPFRTIVSYIDSVLGAALDKAGIFFGHVFDGSPNFLCAGLPSAGQSLHRMPYGTGFPFAPAKLVDPATFIGGEVLFFCAASTEAYFEGGQPSAIDMSSVTFDLQQIARVQSAFRRVAWHVVAGNSFSQNVPNVDFNMTTFYNAVQPLLPPNYLLEKNGIVSTNAIGNHVPAYDFTMLAKLVNSIQTFFSL